MQPTDCKVCLGIVYGLAYYKDQQLMEHVHTAHINPTFWIIIVGIFGVYEANYLLDYYKDKEVGWPPPSVHDISNFEDKVC